MGPAFGTECRTCGRRVTTTFIPTLLSSVPFLLFLLAARLWPLPKLLYIVIGLAVFALSVVLQIFVVPLRAEA
jgi:hypothetical protein